MTIDRAQAFAAALNTLENDADVSRFISDMFAAEVVLVRPETHQQEGGTPGAQAFWQQYVDQFQEVRSDFTRITGDETGVLEWTSTGRRLNGTDISYSGVSLVDFDADGRVVRFATYYDTSAFIAT